MLLQKLNHPNCINFLGSRPYCANGGTTPAATPASRGGGKNAAPKGTYDVGGAEATHIHTFLEFVPGGTISDLVETFGRITDLFLIRSLTWQIARGLVYLHRKGIVHRDLKGSNVLLSLHGDAILTDMGTAFIANRHQQNNEETMRLMEQTSSIMEKTGALGQSATIMM
ncbi:unnamed protein product, partial [Amoebophrya sp. A25]|eukprot:GSA25T00019448001.1